MPTIVRNRWLYAGLVLLTVIMGLSSRYFAAYLPAFLVNHAGDALWALMVFWLIGGLLPRLATGYVALLALTFAFCIEFSQLYHAPWLDSLRANPLVALVIGRGFLWIDLVRYSVGIGLGMMLELLLQRLLKGSK